MSVVWRAHDRTLDRTVALKILSPTADGQRFRRESQAVAALAHDNVMRVYDYGEDEAGPFMALEHIPQRHHLDNDRSSTAATTGTTSG